MSGPVGWWAELAAVEEVELFASLPYSLKLGGGQGPRNFLGSCAELSKALDLFHQMYSVQGRKPALGPG